MSLVARFHRAFRLPAPSAPVLDPDPDLVRLRLRLITEEFHEVRNELIRLATPGLQISTEDRADTLRNLLKELADLRYVTEGCAVSLGLPIEDAFKEVHASNMSKLGEDGQPIFRADGKVLKGPRYREANMDQFVHIVEGSTS